MGPSPQGEAKSPSPLGSLQLDYEGRVSEHHLTSEGAAYLTPLSLLSASFSPPPLAGIVPRG